MRMRGRMVIAGLTDLPVITAFEINASCPNTSAGGLSVRRSSEQIRQREDQQ